MPEEYPDARLVVRLATEGDDLEQGLERLNPILKEILLGRSAQIRRDPLTVANFGRLTFSQTK